MNVANPDDVSEILAWLRGDENGRILMETTCPMCGQLDDLCREPDGTYYSKGLHNAKVTAAIHIVDFRDRGTP